MEKHTKELILSKVLASTPTYGRNSMGCNESFYDPYFMLYKCFDTTALQEMTESELNIALRVAMFSAEVFY
jgi:hypothetical protein